RGRHVAEDAIEGAHAPALPEQPEEARRVRELRLFRRRSDVSDDELRVSDADAAEVRDEGALDADPLEPGPVAASVGADPVAVSAALALRAAARHRHVRTAVVACVGRGADDDALVARPARRAVGPLTVDARDPVEAERGREPIELGALQR